MDPFRDCQKIFGSHFRDQMFGRHLPLEDINKILDKGKKSATGDNDYSVTLGRWTIQLTVFSCTLFLGTAFLR